MKLDSYCLVSDESPDTARRIERDALDRIIQELINSRNNTREYTLKAVESVEVLWLALLDDLSSPANALSDSLKAKLISIGIWMIKEVMTVRQSDTATIDHILEINQIIRNGLD